MFDLYDFKGKSIEIILKDGKKYIGYVDYFSPALDNDDYIAEDSIGILPNKNAKSGIEVFQSEIKSIKIVD